MIKIIIVFSERPPTKKRRLDITLQNCILDNLKPNLDQPEEVVIPWLQILAALINNLDPEVLEGKIHDYWKYILNILHIYQILKVISGCFQFNLNLIQIICST